MHHCILVYRFTSVHHSAEVMNPLTLYRKHPLYDVVKSFVKTPIIGTLQGIVALMLLGITDVYQLLGINVVFSVFNLLGANLRHIHIWVSFGPILNYIFMSPSQHQIHHSARPEHRDCNFGEMFAIWDWMGGTLVLPTEDIRNNLIFGISLDEPQPHPTLMDAYVEPLTKFWETLRMSSLGRKFGEPLRPWLRARR